MSQRQKDPLRAMTEEEEAWLQRIARATCEPATHVIRAKQLIAVAAGQSYSRAARLTGRRSGDAVAQLVWRFNREGVSALERRGGGGAKPTYGVGEREWMFAHGSMPLYTPLSGSWLNMTESIQRILKRRALEGQHPQTPADIIAFREATVQGW